VPSINARPVTKNALTAARAWSGSSATTCRCDRKFVRRRSFGEQRGRDGVVIYDYTQATVGLAFYRSIRHDGRCVSGGPPFP
jgi:hypothetical protein